MDSFLTRVELHGAAYDGSYYEVLHQKMAAQGFVRTVVSDDGKKLALPTAEYEISGYMSKEDILARAKTAASATGKPYSIFIVKHSGWIAHGLVPVR